MPCSIVIVVFVVSLREEGVPMMVIWPSGKLDMHPVNCIPYSLIYPSGEAEGLPTLEDVNSTSHSGRQNG
jgi:hypothetical protein